VIKYLIKTLSIVAKQKVLLFTVNITRNRMQNPIIKILVCFKLAADSEHSSMVNEITPFTV
jgi:hypothetical protein